MDRRHRFCNDRIAAKRSPFQGATRTDWPAQRAISTTPADSLLAGPQVFWLHFGGPENARWPVRAIENLVTGEQYLLDWNGRRLRIDRRRILRCCSVVMPRRPDMNIVPTLDIETAQKLDDRKLCF